MPNIIEQQQETINGLAQTRDADLGKLFEGSFFTAAPQFPPTLMSRLITQTENTITLGSIAGLQNAVARVEGTGADKVAGVQGKLDEFIILKQEALEKAQEVVDAAKLALAESQSLEKSIEKRATISKTTINSEEKPEARAATLAAAREVRNKIRDEIAAMQAAKAQIESQATVIESTYVKDLKVEEEKLAGLEKEGAKKLLSFQEGLFKEIIQKATLAQVNTRLGVADQKTTAQIAAEVAKKDLSAIKDSLTKDQQAELDATISALKEGKVQGEEIDRADLFEGIDREVEKSVKGIFNNPNYKSISTDILNEFLSQPTFKGLQGKVELNLVRNEEGEMAWEVKAKDEVAVDDRDIARLQGDLDTRLRTDEKLQAKTKDFLGVVNGAVEESQKSPTLWDQFVNFINRIKQKLGFDVKLESKEEISSKQERAAKRSFGKFSENVLSKPTAQRSMEV